MRKNLPRRHGLLGEKKEHREFSILPRTLCALCLFFVGFVVKLLKYYFATAIL